MSNAPTFFKRPPSIKRPEIPSRPSSFFEQLTQGYMLNIDPLIFWRSQAEQEFRHSVQNNQFTDDQPLLAARVHFSPPKNVFISGMTAYDPMRILCKNPINLAGLTLAALLIMANYRITLGLAAAIVLILWKANLLYGNPNHSFYGDAYVSGSPALAFSRESFHARAYHSVPQKDWCYGVYFPNGCVDFSAYSRHALKGEWHISSGWDAQEVLPRNLYNQTVSPEQVIFAYALDPEDSAHVATFSDWEWEYRKRQKPAEGYDAAKKSLQNGKAQLEPLRQELFKKARAAFYDSEKSVTINMDSVIAQELCNKLAQLGHRCQQDEGQAYSQVIRIKPVALEKAVHECLQLAHRHVANPLRI